MNRHGAAAVRIGALLMIGLVAVVSCSGIVAASGPADVDLSALDGDGSSGNPYVVTNTSELQAMNQSLTSHYVLGNDIDAAETDHWNGGAGFDPIGDATTAFSGDFNGSNYTVSDLHIDRDGTNYVGLFGDVATGSVIENLRVVEVDVTGNERVGSVAGNNDGTVRDTTATGAVVGSGNRTGGLVGNNDDNGDILRSGANTNVTGAHFVGGLIGNDYAGVVKNTWAVGNITGTEYIGGLIGHIDDNSDVRNSFAAGNVTGSAAVGGVLGRNKNNAATTVDLYWDTERSNQPVGVGIQSGDTTGLKTLQMQGSNASDTNNLNGFDFGTTWTTVAGDYPDLRSAPRVVSTPHFSAPDDAEKQTILADMAADGTTRLVTSDKALQAIDRNTTTLGWNYRLALDIDASETYLWNDGAGFTPIGSDFSGELDGDRHTVSELSIDRPATNNVGLFELVSGTVTNVTLEDANVTAKRNFGTLAGALGDGSTATRVAVSGGNVTSTVTDPEIQAGGLAGSSGGTISQSTVSATVDTPAGQEVGGIVGDQTGTGVVEASYFSGSVNGTGEVGGVLGNAKSGATLRNTYAVGAVSADNSAVGGLVGNDEGVDVTDSYWDTEATTQSASAGGGEGLTTFEMTSLVATETMDLDFENTWNATQRYPRLDWESVDELDPYPTATPGEGEVWLLNDTGTAVHYQRYVIDGGDVRWLSEVVASPGTNDTAQVIEIAAGNATADYDTLVVGSGDYTLETQQVNLTASGSANLTRLFSYNGSDGTKILRVESAGFTDYEESLFRVDNPATSTLSIGQNGSFAADGDGGFYIESEQDAGEASPLIGVYDAADQFNLTVTNTTFGMWTNHGDTILLEDSGTAFDLELDVVSHSGALINASAASGLSVTNSTITEENDPRGNGLDGEGISLLKLEASGLDDLTVENVTIAGATEANNVNGVVDIVSLATDASVTIDDLEIENTSQNAINVATDIESLSLSGLNLTDIGKRGLTLTSNVSSVIITDSEVDATSATSFFTDTTANVSRFNVTGTTITDSSGRGIYLRGDIGNATIENNTLTDSVLTPIEFNVNAGQSTPYEILDNHLDGSGNSNSLVVIRQHAQVNITDNTLLNSSLRGIYLDAADSVVESTRIENSSGGKGIHLAGNANDALVANTTINESATLGIHVDGANNATIRNTTVDTTGDYGIRFNNSAADGELVGSTIRNTAQNALQVGSDVVSVEELSLMTGTISAAVTDAALNTSATVPTAPASYQSGDDAVNATFDGGQLDNVSLSYTTSAFDIDQRALDLWRYNATGWHRADTTVETGTQVVTTTRTITDASVLTTFASNVSITAADTTVDAGETGTIDLNATNANGTGLQTVELNVTDDGGLDGISVGDTVTTDADGEANVSFQESTSGTYTIVVGWTNDTTVTDTATVTVRSTGGGDDDDNGGGGGGGGGGGAPREEGSGTTVTVGESDDAEGSDGSDDSEGSTGGDSESGGDSSGPDTSVSVSNPVPGQTLVIEGDRAYISGNEPADDSSESDGSEGSEGGDDNDDSSTPAAGGSADDSSASSSNVRSDRLSVAIDTDRDFELSVTTYETDLTRSSASRNTRASMRPFASGVALLQPVGTAQQVSAPETVRSAAASFERETSTVSAGYVDIEHTLEPGEIAGATFEFSIRQAYLDRLGVDAEAVTLYHRTDGEWVTRETTLTGTDETHYRFEGTMPEFSVFALGTGAPPIGVSDASLSASAVDPGETATVSATVENRGQADAEGTVELTVDGEVIDSETVSLAGAETTAVSFDYTPESAGEYAVAVSGTAAGSLTVGDGGGQPWWLVGLLLVVAAMAGVLWRRRDSDE